VDSSESSISIDGRCVFFRRPHIKAWHHKPGSLSPFLACGGHAPPSSLPTPDFRWFPATSTILAGDRRSSGGAWSSRATTGGSQSTPLNQLSIIVLAVVYLCYLGYCFPLWETIVFEIVLVSLFTAVLFMDSNNVFTIPAIFW
jgi:hypothetical protein